MRPQVLIVHAEKDVRPDVRTALESRGVQVLSANTGDEALAAVEQNANIRVLILERCLGEEDGKDVLKKVRELRPAIGSIVIIDTMSPSIVSETVSYEGDFLFPSRFDLDDLLNAVKELLRKSKQTQADLGVNSSGTRRTPILNIADGGPHIDAPPDLADPLFRRFRSAGIRCHIHACQDIRLWRIVFASPWDLDKIISKYTQWEEERSVRMTGTALQH